MQYHENTVPPEGVFHDMAELTDDRLINFSMTVPEKQQFCRILAQSMT